MKVFIASSASETIDNKYLVLAKEISEYLAENEYDLNFGAADYSMMGECYKSFVNHGREVNAITVSKYSKDLLNLDDANCKMVDDTLERFRELYFKSEYVVILPGGIGTLAEFVCSLEEFRASIEKKKIILVNYDNYYIDIINWLNKNIETGFLNKDINDCYVVVNNVEEFKKYMEENI